MKNKNKTLCDKIEAMALFLSFVELASKHKEEPKAMSIHMDSIPNSDLVPERKKK